MDLINDDDENRLRKFKHKAFDPIWSKVMDLIVKLMDLLATIKMGQKKNRVGVFGPYDAANRKVIDELMKKLSTLGWATITGEGYYLPSDPESFHKIEEIMPEEASIFLTDYCLYMFICYIFQELLEKPFLT